MNIEKVLDKLCVHVPCKVPDRVSGPVWISVREDVWHRLWILVADAIHDKINKGLK